MWCDHFTPNRGRCRHWARVYITFRTKEDMLILDRRTKRCWPHYLELENKARLPDATFTILKVEVIDGDVPEAD